MKVVVTGASRGIGLELCKQLKERGDEVVALCRQVSEKLQGLGVRVLENVDVSSDDSVANACQVLAGEPIDLLINNAGIWRTENLDSMNLDTIREQFETNTLGPVRMTMALLDNLKSGSKIAMITSRMGSINDNDSGGRYGYRMSKTALNSMAKSLAIDLQPNGIAVAILHPGYVRTDMTSHHGLIDPEESAAGLLQRMDGLNLDNSGTFWHANGEVLPW